jgi:hypothetical protein
MSQTTLRARCAACDSSHCPFLPLLARPRPCARRYYAQTTLCRDKLPLGDAGGGAQAKLSLVWTDSLRPKKQVAHASWSYEQACVLFNLAAVEAQLAAVTPRDTPAGIEAAGKRFCAAAGVLAHVRDVTLGHGGGILGGLPVDLTRDGLSMLVALLLAQVSQRQMQRARSNRRGAVLLPHGLSAGIPGQSCGRLLPSRPRRSAGDRRCKLTKQASMRLPACPSTLITAGPGLLLRDGARQGHEAGDMCQAGGAGGCERRGGGDAAVGHSNLLALAQPAALGT